MPRPRLEFLARTSPRRHPRRSEPRPRTRIPDDAPPTDAIFIVLRRMRAPLIFLIVIFAISVFGLTLIPGKNSSGKTTHLDAFDAFYFICYTASTIGFGEVVPFTTQQRMWVTGCIFMTVVGWAYALGTLMSLLQSSAFQYALTTQRFRSKVRRIREPFFIVCGYGQAGRLVCKELDTQGVRFVVIDKESSRLDHLATSALQSDVPSLAADAGLPRILGMAGLANRHCRGVLALTDDDTNNLSIVMATELLRPRLHVIARCMDRVVEERMDDFAPGAVINPSDRYGAYLVLALQRPATFALVSWMLDPDDSPLPKTHAPSADGRWVVCADGEFGAEIAADLQAAGMRVEQVDPADGHPDLTGIHGFVAGTESDTTNLALAEHAKLAQPDLFVAVRQQSDARSVLIESLRVDSVFTPTNLVAQETLARVITPLFWRFVEHAVTQPNEFAQNILDHLGARCGSGGKDRMIIDIDARNAPAMYRWLNHNELTIHDILRSRDERENSLGLVVLMLIRDGKDHYAPDESMPLQQGDRLLVVGHTECLDSLHATQFSDAAVEYVATGREMPEAGVWRRLSRSTSAMDDPSITESHIPSG